MNTEPKITKTKKGWRIDCPDGNFCYQPSESFAISWARQWQVSANMSREQVQLLRARARRRDTTGYLD